MISLPLLAPVVSEPAAVCVTESGAVTSATPGQVPRPLILLAPPPYGHAPFPSQKKLGEELHHTDSRFEEKKRKFLEDSEKFRRELKRVRHTHKTKSLYMYIWVENQSGLTHKEDGKLPEMLIIKCTYRKGEGVPKHESSATSETHRVFPNWVYILWECTFHGSVHSCSQSFDAFGTNIPIVQDCGDPPVPPSPQLHDNPPTSWRKPLVQLSAKDLPPPLEKPKVKKL